jgi:hypothetical protein
MDHQSELVHQIVFHQRLDELTASQDDDVLSVLLLELGDRLGGVALQQGRVLPPERLTQRVLPDYPSRAPASRSSPTDNRDSGAQALSGE